MTNTMSNPVPAKLAALLILLTIAAAIVIYSFTGCAQKSASSASGAATTGTSQVQSDEQIAAQLAETTLAQALSVGISSALSNAEGQLIATGSVNAKQLAAATIDGEATVAQGLIGATMPADLAAATAGDPTIAAAIAPIIAKAGPLSQTAVNAMFAAAAKLVPPAPAASPSPTP